MCGLHRPIWVNTLHTYALSPIFPEHSSNSSDNVIIATGVRAIKGWGTTEEQYSRLLGGYSQHTSGPESGTVHPLLVLDADYSRKLYLTLFH